MIIFHVTVCTLHFQNHWNTIENINYLVIGEPLRQRLEMNVMDTILLAGNEEEQLEVSISKETSPAGKATAPRHVGRVPGALALQRPHAAAPVHVHAPCN